MNGHIIMDEAAIHRCIVRLSHEIEERNEGLENVVLIGVDEGGKALARRVSEYYHRAYGDVVPHAGIEEAPLEVEGKAIVLCEEVLRTGRSAIEGIEKIFSFGCPARIQLLALIDRGGRELPVRADFVGKNVPTSRAEYVEIALRELGAPSDAIAITGGKA